MATQKTAIEKIRQAIKDLMADPTAKAVIEGVKELGRTGLIAALAVATDQLLLGKYEPRLVVLAFIVAVLRAVDKTLHEYGKSVGSETIAAGLTRF